MSALGKMSGDGPEQEDSKQGGTQKCAERRGSGFLMEGNILAAQKMFAPKKPWKSSAARIPAASLTHPLHPMETLGRGMGTEIAVDPSPVQADAPLLLPPTVLAASNGTAGSACGAAAVDGWHVQQAGGGAALAVAAPPFASNVHTWRLCARPADGGRARR